MDIVCSQLSSLTLSLIVVTFTIGMALAFFLFKFWDFIKSSLTMSALSITLFVFVSLLNTICVFPNARAAFKADYDVPSVPCFVKRSAEVDLLMEYLQPSTLHPKGYFLLEGLHGSGKSTLLQQSILPYSESGIAHLYIKVNVKGDITNNLYSALKLKEYCDSYWATICSYLNIPSNTCPNDPVARLEYALNVLTVVASEIRNEDGIPPLVIFDNIARILTQPNGTEIIHILQEMAKDASDEGSMVVLFTSSESDVPKIMRSRSAKSRLRAVIQIGEITDEEALEYLTCMCPNASKEDVTKAVQLFGGRFIHLTHAADALPSGEAGIDRLKEKVFNDIWTTVIDLPPKVRNVLMVVVQNILQSPTKMITKDNYYGNLVRELSKDDLRLIDMTNILYINARRGVYLGSRVVEIYFKEEFSKSDSLIKRDALPE